MNGRFNDLNSSIIADVVGYVGWQWYLWKAECTRVHVVYWSCELENWDHGVRVVQWLGSESNVDVNEGCLMSIEPAWLEGDCSSGDGPFRSILCHW
jgi:hypothetical protein